MNVVDDNSQAIPTNSHQNTSGRVLSLPSIMGSTLPTVVSGRRASSPSPRPGSPTNASFNSSSLQHPYVATISHTSKPNGRFSDAFAGLSGRSRGLSIDSDSHDETPGKQKKGYGIAEENMIDSSFGIDADPFASHINDTETQDSHHSVCPSSFSPPSSSKDLPSSNRKNRGSLLFAASDALGFGRVGASISKRMSKRVSVDQNTLVSQSNSTSSSPQQWKGLPWKAKGKTKGHWALRPPSSVHVISDVIEISAAKAGSISARDEEDENERRERDRLRVEAAESIGISPLLREDSSSRLTGLTGNDSFHIDDDSPDEDTGTRDAHEESKERLQCLDRSRSSVHGSVKVPSLTNMAQIQQLQSRENRHARSSSLSGMVTPTTPLSSNWPISSSTNGHTRTPKGSVSGSFSQTELPSFPCILSMLESLTSKSSSALKFHVVSPLLFLGVSRQWRTRFIVLTTPARPKSPLQANFHSYTPERQTSVCHLHVFKSSAPDEREIERLEVNENSVVFIAEEEVAGKRQVVKVGGIDVSGKRKDMNMEENGQTMWFLSISDFKEAQSWIAILKDAVFDQRSEKAGFGMPTNSRMSPGPKGDLDVMLSMRAQDIASFRSQTQVSSTLISSNLDFTRKRGASSPAPTMRSWSGERKSNENRLSSPPGKMVSLKGLFSVPGRTRSMSRSTDRSDTSSLSPTEPSSFTSRGTALLSMIRPANENGHQETTESDPKPIPTSFTTAKHVISAPILTTEAIFSNAEMNLDRSSLKSRDRELPEWYSIENRQHTRGDSSSSVNASPALLPPPRNKRPWTSAGFLGNVNREESSMDNGSPTPRKSFQSTASNHSERHSSESKGRSPSPSDSLGAPGVFGSPDLKPKDNRRSSLSSSVSSFIAPSSERDQSLGRSNSLIQQRFRVGKVPKMLAPPTGPPPSVPSIPSQPSSGSGMNEKNVFLSLDSRSPSRASSIRSVTNSDVMQNGTISARRLSTSSVLSSGSSQLNPKTSSGIRQISLSPKRLSVPPPQRPAPTTALPPTPAQADGAKQSETTPRRSSFRDSLSHRSLRFSLTPPPVKSSLRSDDAFRRRSLSNGSTVSSNHSFAPPAPPPTGPLPPLPQDLPPARQSFRERLRMKSAPSTPPTSLPGSTPLVTVSSVSSLKDARQSVVIGEPITAIPKDLNFLNMVSPVEQAASSNDDINFLNMTSPLTTTFPKSIIPPPRTSDSPSPINGSPPNMTVLPPPPRRNRAGTFSEKDRDRSSQTLEGISMQPSDGPVRMNMPLEAIATV